MPNDMTDESFPEPEPLPLPDYPRLAEANIEHRRRAIEAQRVYEEAFRESLDKQDSRGYFDTLKDWWFGNKVAPHHQYNIETGEFEDARIPIAERAASDARDEFDIPESTYSDPAPLPLPDWAKAVVPPGVNAKEFGAISKSPEPEAMPSPEWPSVERPIVQDDVPVMEAPEPEAMPSPEWPSAEQLQEMLAPIPEMPFPSDERLEQQRQRHERVMRRLDAEESGGTVGRPKAAKPDTEHGGWTTFNMSGDNQAERDISRMSESLEEIKENTGKPIQFEMQVFDRIDRRLSEILTLMRSMA